MHNRAKSLTIKNFHSQNACIAAKPMRKIERKDSEGLVTLFDYSWEEPSSLAEFNRSPSELYGFPAATVAFRPYCSYHVKANYPV